MKQSNELRALRAYDFFKNFAIPRIENMLQKEKEHLSFLKKYKANSDSIKYCKEMINHYTIRLKQYQEYINSLN